MGGGLSKHLNFLLFPYSQRVIEAQVEERRKRREQEEAKRRQEEDDEERRVTKEREMLQTQYELEVMKKSQEVRMQQTYTEKHKSLTTLIIHLC